MVLGLLLFIMPIGAESSEIIYLLSKYKSSEFLKNKSYVREDGGTTIVPSTFSMTFEVKKVLQNENKFEKKSVTFPMDIETIYPFTKSDAVLIVKKSKKHEYELLDWDFVRNVFCVNKEFVPEKYSDYYFDKPRDSKKNKKCRFISTKVRG